MLETEARRAFQEADFNKMISQTVYLDNAATTKMSRVAIDATLQFTDGIYGNPSSPHREGQKAAKALLNARERIAECLGCHGGEITFTSCGSEADNQAIISAARLGEKCGKRHIISTAAEHHAVLKTLETLKESGFEITLLDVDEKGFITPGQVRDSIREDTCLVTVIYANNEIGTIQPITEIGAVCREGGVLFHTDAVAAVGHIPIDVKKQNIDMLSLSAHKFHGPKGIGVLYAKKGIILKSLIEGGAQERGRRAGTENLPAIMGMSAALEDRCANIQENTRRVKVLSNRLIKSLSEIPRSFLNGDPLRRLPGNVSFCFEGIDGEALILMLDNMGICASYGAACASGSLEPSHVLLAIGRPRNIALGALRLSLSEDNTEDEIDYVIDSVKSCVERLRAFSRQKSKT